MKPHDHFLPGILSLNTNVSGAQPSSRPLKLPWPHTDELGSTASCSTHSDKAQATFLLLREGMAGDLVFSVGLESLRTARLIDGRGIPLREAASRHVILFFVTSLTAFAKRCVRRFETICAFMKGSLECICSWNCEEISGEWKGDVQSMEMGECFASEGEEGKPTGWGRDALLCRQTLAPFVRMFWFFVKKARVLWCAYGICAVGQISF